MSTRVVSHGQFGATMESQFQPVYRHDYGSARVSPEGYVHNVMIAHDRRGEGHGTELMSQITQHADRLGKPLTLNAREELHPWYQRLGFKVTGEDRFGDTAIPRLERKPGGG